MATGDIPVTISGVNIIDSRMQSWVPGLPGQMGDCLQFTQFSGATSVTAVNGFDLLTSLSMMLRKAGPGGLTDTAFDPSKKYTVTFTEE